MLWYLLKVTATWSDNSLYIRYNAVGSFATWLLPQNLIGDFQSTLVRYSIQSIAGIKSCDLSDLNHLPNFTHTNEQRKLELFSGLFHFNPVTWCNKIKWPNHLVFICHWYITFIIMRCNSHIIFYCYTCRILSTMLAFLSHILSLKPWWSLAGWLNSYWKHLVNFTCTI